MRGQKKIDWIFPLLVLIMIEFAAAAIYMPIEHVRVAAAIERASRFELAYVAQKTKADPTKSTPDHTTQQFVFSPPEIAREPQGQPRRVEDQNPRSRTEFPLGQAA